MNRILRCSLSVVLLTMAVTATAAAATDEKPQAQSEKVVVHEGQADATVKAPVIKRSDEQKILRSIQEDGRDQVAKLVTQLPMMPDEAAVAVLQKEIEEAKLQTRVRVLEKIVELAEARGDGAKANEARQILELTLEGPQATPSNVSREAPRSSQEGR